MSEQIDNLIAILFDSSASIAARDDAAMDLGEHDAALDALLRFAVLADENKTLQESCGGSIAEIWKRLGCYDESLLATFAPSVQSEIRAAFDL